MSFKIENACEFNYRLLSKQLLSNRMLLQIQENTINKRSSKLTREYMEETGEHEMEKTKIYLVYKFADTNDELIECAIEIMGND